MNEQKENIAIQRSKRIKISATPKSIESTSDIASSNPIEKDIIELLLEGKLEIIELIFDHIHPDEIKNEKFKKIMRIIEECYKNGNSSLSVILDKIDALSDAGMNIPGHLFVKNIEPIKSLLGGGWYL